ncbi:MAG: hypothetical protein KAV00_17040 [Phycisphaerae bacterium]|nr:hypothetical protein [Phycisphaerae bacterium]
MAGPTKLKTKGAKSKHTARLIKTAYHEAGHAVACIALRKRFKYVTIEPDDERNSLGHIRHAPSPDNLHPYMDNQLRFQRFVEREIMILFAGGAAEALHKGRHNYHGSRNDRRDAIDFAFSICCRSSGGSGEQAEAYCNWLIIRTRDMLGSAMWWPAVKAIAVALLKHKRLSYHQARKAWKEDDKKRFEKHLARFQQKG